MQKHFLYILFYLISPLNVCTVQCTDYRVHALINILSCNSKIWPKHFISLHFSMGWQLYGTGHGHSHGGGGAPAGHSHSENMNVRAAFIHVLGDVLQSIGVFCAAIIIYFNPTWQLADPICTFIFSIIVLWTTITILKDAILVSIYPVHTANTAAVAFFRHFRFSSTLIP